jgi:hypothetical protein
MRMMIRDRGVKMTAEAQERIERSVRAALDRFERRIKTVTIGLTDLNGPRGGVDKRCRVEVALEPSRVVFVQEDGQDLVATVHAAADRVGFAVARTLQRDRRSPKPTTLGV